MSPRSGAWSARGTRQQTDCKAGQQGRSVSNAACATDLQATAGGRARRRGRRGACRACSWRFDPTSLLNAATHSLLLPDAHPRFLSCTVHFLVDFFSHVCAPVPARAPRAREIVQSSLLSVAVQVRTRQRPSGMPTARKCREFGVQHTQLPRCPPTAEQVNHDTPLRDGLKPSTHRLCTAPSTPDRHPCTPAQQVKHGPLHTRLTTAPSTPELQRNASPGTAGSWPERPRMTGTSWNEACPRKRREPTAQAQALPLR